MIFRLSPTDLDKNYLANRPYKAMPISADFSKLVVNKPWGSEYLMYSNPAIEIWNLFIGHGKATSMHCHPNKKTTLIVLDGKALFSSLNESMELSPMCAIMIEPGVFHSTQAISKSGIRVLEFENPPMKHDLIRLEDKYGRANEGYEGLEKMMPNGHHIRLGADDIGRVNRLYNSEICIKSVANNNNYGDLSTLNNDKNALSIVLGGSITSKYGDVLYSVADVLHTEESDNGNGIVYNNLQFLTIKPIESK